MVELKKYFEKSSGCCQLASVEVGTSTKIIPHYVGTSTFGSFGYSARFVEFSTPPSGRKWKFCKFRSAAANSQPFVAKRGRRRRPTKELGTLPFSYGHVALAPFSRVRMLPFR